MLRRLFTAIGALMLLGVTCSLGAQQKANNTESREIASVLEKQAADWNRGDLLAFMNGYWKSSETEFVNAAGIFAGWNDVLKRYQSSYPNRAAMGHLTFSGLEIHVLCGDYAYVIGKFRLDREKDHPQGAYTLIFRKFADGWKIVNDHTTQYAVSK